MLVGSGVTAQRAGGGGGGGGQAASSIRIGVGAGLLLPISDYKTSDKLGWLAGADVTYWLTGGMFGLRAEGSYSHASEAPGLSAHTTKIFGGMAGRGLGPGRWGGRDGPSRPAARGA